MRSLTAGAALVGLVLWGTRRLLSQWGSSKSEVRASLPGDELVPGPCRTTTRAVIVHAPAGHVWRWLVQIGQDRGGLYSYDRLENLLGLDIHSACEIRPQWQHLVVGDQIRLVPEGWLGLRDGYALSVAEIQPGRALVLHDPLRPVTWSFHIDVLDSMTCRLITRGRAPRSTGLGVAIDLLMGPIEFAMSRRMLLGIKQRAEGAVDDPIPRRTVAERTLRAPGLSREAAVSAMPSSHGSQDATREES